MCDACHYGRPVVKHGVAPARTTTPILNDAVASARTTYARLQVAHKLGACAVVLIGGSEVADNTATVKVMHTGEQRHVKLSDVATQLQHALQAAG